MTGVDAFLDALVKVVKDVGFPIGVALYLLIFIDRTLKSLRDAITQENNILTERVLIFKDMNAKLDKLVELQAAQLEETKAMKAIWEDRYNRFIKGGN